MTEYENITSELNNKVDKLVYIINQYKNENLALKAENKQLHEAIKQKTSESEALTEQYDTLKLGKVIALAGNDVHDAKIKVNRIVREIDKCIALLNR